MQEDNKHRMSQMQTSAVTVTAAHLRTVDDTCVCEYDHITDQKHKHMQYACLDQHENFFQKLPQ